MIFQSAFAHVLPLNGLCTLNRQDTIHRKWPLTDQFLLQSNCIPSFYTDAQRTSRVSSWDKNLMKLRSGSVKERQESPLTSVSREVPTTPGATARSADATTSLWLNAMADRNVRRRARGGTEQSHWAKLTGSANPPSGQPLKRGHRHCRASLK